MPMAQTTTRSFEFQSFDGTVLRGVWTQPEVPLRAAALILQGSGNVDADGDVSSPLIGAGYQNAPAKLSKQLADTLSAMGITTLRFEKRGYESDPSRAIAQSISVLAQDAECALREVRRTFPHLKSYVVGLSEGALLATLVAAKTAPEQLADGLFLLGLPTRGIDEIFEYQFINWPLERLQLTLDPDGDGILEESELESLGTSQPLPILAVPWSALDPQRTGRISLDGQFKPAALQYFEQLKPLLNTPAFGAWYDSMRSLAPFKELASAVRVPTYLYQGALDAQLRPAWLQQDMAYFQPGVIQKLQIFEGLGHCFAPMEGAIGQIKTSGPLNEAVLSVLAQDINKTTLS